MMKNQQDLRRKICSSAAIRLSAVARLPSSSCDSSSSSSSSFPASSSSTSSSSSPSSSFSFSCFPSSSSSSSSYSSSTSSSSSSSWFSSSSSSSTTFFPFPLTFRFLATTTCLLVLSSVVGAYQVLSDDAHFQVDRRCDVACFASAETQVEALPGESVQFNCRTDKEDIEIRKLWTTDGGKYVAMNDESYIDRYSISDHGSTLRISPVTQEDDGKSLWCNLLVFDAAWRRWRPRKTIRHFLYVGAGKMKLTPQDLMNLDVKDSNVLYHHRKIDELDSEQKASGKISASNVSVENIFFNGTMEKDDFFADAETDAEGDRGGNVKEEKQFLDLGEKFKKTIKDSLPSHLEREIIAEESLASGGAASGGAALDDAAFNDAASGEKDAAVGNKDAASQADGAIHPPQAFGVASNAAGLKVVAKRGPLPHSPFDGFSRILISSVYFCASFWTIGAALVLAGAGA